MKRKTFKGSLWLGLAAVSIVLFLPAAARASTNVVPNPGFEQGGCGVSTLIVCGWESDVFISQDTTNAHSGVASLSLGCNGLADSCSAWTDPGFCAAIGPGVHAASFWYANLVGSTVDLEAAFFPTSDCTGPGSSDSLVGGALGDGWRQVTGALFAPPGTQSALFSVGVSDACIGGCDAGSGGDGCQCASANFDDVYVEDPGDTSPPTLTSFTPTSGPPGIAVSITGNDFLGASRVTIAGRSAGFTVNSPTSITAWVSKQSQSATGPITVTTANGTATSTTSFAIACESPGPTIDSITPSQGPVGTTVAIKGTNLTGVNQVLFTGEADYVFTVVSDSELLATVPIYAATGPITLETFSYSCTSSSPFTVTPAISSITPTSGPVGTSVDIQGTSFNGATSVEFNGTADPSFEVKGSEDIAAHVPTGATTGPISVTTPSGTATSPGSFLVTSTISSFTPTSGPVGASVDIQGTNFTGATSVTFNGTADPDFVVNSPTTITATVPTAATTGPITVTTPGGTATSAGAFTVTPTISSFTPTSGHAGATVTINGSGLAGTTSVKLGAFTAKFTVNSPTRITATVPAIPHGNYRWTVTTPGGSATSTGTFHVL